MHSAETDNDLKSRHPYKEWLEKNVIRLTPFEAMEQAQDAVGQRSMDNQTLASYQKQFAYSSEELEQVIRVLGENGQEATGSMGMTPHLPCFHSVHAFFMITFASHLHKSLTPYRST